MSSVVTTVLSLVKLTHILFRSSLETNIKLEHKLEIYRASFKIIFQLTLFTSIENCTDYLPDIVKVESLSAKKPIFGELYGVYEVNENLSTKQWSLAPKLIKIRASFNIFLLVLNTIDSLDNYFLDIIFCSIYSMKLEDSIILRVGFWEEDSSSSNILK